MDAAYYRPVSSYVVKTAGVCYNEKRDVLIFHLLGNLPRRGFCNERRFKFLAIQEERRPPSRGGISNGVLRRRTDGRTRNLTNR